MGNGFKYYIAGVLCLSVGVLGGLFGGEWMARPNYIYPKNINGKNYFVVENKVGGRTVFEDIDGVEKYTEFSNNTKRERMNLSVKRLSEDSNNEGERSRLEKNILSGIKK